MQPPSDTREYHKWLLKQNRNKFLPTPSPSAARGTPFAGDHGSSMANDPNHTATCYDHYFCQVPALATLSHVLMGGIALFLAVCAILTNTLLIPIFNMVGIRSSATVYMTGIAVCDTISLILVVMLVVVKNLPTTLDGQLNMYQNFSGYLLPFGWPVKELVELMSLWLVVALLIDRFLYHKKFSNFNQNLNRSRCVKLLLFLIIFFAIYTIPKFLKYKLVETIGPNETAQVKVMLTLIAQGSSYQNIMFWLKLPIEVALPYLFILLLVIIIGYSLRKPKNVFQYESTCRMVTRDKMEIRETTNTHLALLIGLLVLACKLPRFVLQFMSANRDLDRVLLIKFTIAAEFLEICCLSLKPLIYILFGGHIRKVCADMFCLCLRPSKTREIVLAGGLGSTVEIKGGVVSVARSPTALTLLGSSVNAIDERRIHSALFHGEDGAMMAQVEKAAKTANASAATSNGDTPITMRSLATGKTDSSDDSGSDSKFGTPLLSENSTPKSPFRRSSRTSRASYSNEVSL